MRSVDNSYTDQQFVNRWSPRAFHPTPLQDDEIHALFEAARWSPSCFNEQPWRFVIARSRETREKFHSILNDSNRLWAEKAPLLIVVACKKHFDHNQKGNRWCEFDAGAAWMALALQAHSLGLASHAMGGVDVNKAHQICNIDPELYSVICMVAVGRQAPLASLPTALQEREKPSGRNPRAQFVFEASIPE